MTRPAIPATDRWTWTIQGTTTPREAWIQARSMCVGAKLDEVHYDGLGGEKSFKADVGYTAPDHDNPPTGLTRLAHVDTDVAFAARVLLGWVDAHNPAVGEPIPFVSGSLPFGTVIPIEVGGHRLSARLELHADGNRGLSLFDGWPDDIDTSRAPEESVTSSSHASRARLPWWAWLAGGLGALGTALGIAWAVKRAGLPPSPASPGGT
jgi:hypothetical protein